MDTHRIRCPVPVHGVACGREELLAKRRAAGSRPGSSAPVTHHECGEHTFHTEENSKLWYLCTCVREDE